LSLPLGPFQFIYVYGQGDKPIYYTFDRDRPEKLATTFNGFDLQLPTN